MALTLTATQEAVVEVTYADRLGNPANVDGAPAWTVSNSSIVEVVATEDPNIFVIRATGTLGTSQVTVTADADLGDGVREILATEDITVVAAEAVNATIVFGAPREQPLPDPAPVDPTV